MPVDHKRIAELRIARMLTMPEAAKLADMVGRQRWYAVESGRRTNITPDTLWSIARALGVTMDELMTQRRQGVSSEPAAKGKARAAPPGRRGGRPKKTLLPKRGSGA